MGGGRAVNTNRAQDEARAVDRPRAPQKQSQDSPDAGIAPATERERVVPLAQQGRRWTVRIHWGIVFAVVASLVLWLAIKIVIGLAF